MTMPASTPSERPQLFVTPSLYLWFCLWNIFTSKANPLECRQLDGGTMPRLSLPAECKPAAESVELWDSFALPEGR